LSTLEWCDRANSSQWKPKLDHSLHDGWIYLIGMKKDLRPEYPRLELEFLPNKKPVTNEMVPRPFPL